MVDLEGFGEFLRNVVKDIEGGAGEIVRPVQKVGQDIANSGIREDIGSAFRKDITDIGSTIRRDFGSFGDFLRSHKLGLGLLGAGGLAGLGAYEFLRSQGGNSYNSQLGGGAGLGYSTGGGGTGLGSGGGQCDPTCGQIPELPPCPQCGTSGLGGGQISGQGGGGGGGSIFSDPLVWLIIAVVLIIIIVAIIIYYHKKKKKG